MGYSTNKPYQRTTYRAPADGSYDRYLKSGTMVGNKESVLEKPYKVSTYAQMQQDFNIPIPPSFDWGDLPVIPGMDLPPPPGDIIPIGGTGGLVCYWTNTGCEQLVGCWAGSDLVLDGPEAATAGYLPAQVTEGEIVQQTISGSENRGIDFVLNPLVPRNTFTVSFKDANGVIASQEIDITCAMAVSAIYSSALDLTASYNRSSTSIDWMYTAYLNLGLNYFESTAYRDYYVGVQPTTVTIAQGATITSAYITLYHEGNQTGLIQSAEIYVIDVDNANWGIDFYIPTFPTNFWSTKVDWSPSSYENAVSDGSALVTADISTLVQHIVDRAGWSFGNDMGFLIIPTAGTEADKNKFYSGLCTLTVTGNGVV